MGLDGEGPRCVPCRIVSLTQPWRMKTRAGRMMDFGEGKGSEVVYRLGMKWGFETRLEEFRVLSNHHQAEA